MPLYSSGSHALLNRFPCRKRGDFQKLVESKETCWSEPDKKDLLRWAPDERERNIVIVSRLFFWVQKYDDDGVRCGSYLQAVGNAAGHREACGHWVLSTRRSWKKSITCRTDRRAVDRFRCLLSSISVFSPWWIERKRMNYLKCKVCHDLLHLDVKRTSDPFASSSWFYRFDLSSIVQSKNIHSMLIAPSSRHSFSLDVIGSWVGIVSTLWRMQKESGKLGKTERRAR